MFGLLGPNGAGKTTTIRVITTLPPVPHGEVSVFGRDVAPAHDGRPAQIGYVPQQLSTESALTGRQNVVLFARLFDVPRPQRRAAGRRGARAMELPDAADRLPAPTPAA